jgi:5-methylcytosine-specific restriction endonuclease McrA
MVDNTQRNKIVLGNTMQSTYANREKHSNVYYYSLEWQRARLHALNINPLCPLCTSTGLTVVTVVVDQIIPLYLIVNNLQVLCDSFHGRKTIQEGVDRKKKEPQDFD